MISGSIRFFQNIKLKEIEKSKLCVLIPITGCQHIKGGDERWVRYMTYFHSRSWYSPTARKEIEQQLFCLYDFIHEI